MRLGEGRCLATAVVHVSLGAHSGPELCATVPLPCLARRVERLELEAVATRFTLPARAAAFSPSGLNLAAGGDDDGIKLLDVS